MGNIQVKHIYKIWIIYRITPDLQDAGNIQYTTVFDKTWVIYNISSDLQVIGNIWYNIRCTEDNQR